MPITEIILKRRQRLVYSLLEELKIGIAEEMAPPNPPVLSEKRGNLPRLIWLTSAPSEESTAPPTMLYEASPRRLSSYAKGKALIGLLRGLVDLLAEEVNAIQNSRPGSSACSPSWRFFVESGDGKVAYKVLGISALLKYIQYMVSQLKGFTPTNIISRYRSIRDS